MKRLLPAIAIVVLISIQNLNAQDSFSTAKWMSFSEHFTPQQGDYVQPGPDYGCAVNLKRPVWFVISTCGHTTNALNFQEHATVPYHLDNRIDSISMVIWGPFNDSSNVFSQLTSANIVSCNSHFDQYMYNVNITANIEMEPNKLYYGVLTSSDSIISLGLNIGFPINTDEHSDSTYCSICHGRAWYMPQKVCIITVDSATEKNDIFWVPNDSSMAAYIIYRQSSTLGQYDSIGKVLQGEPSNFIDYSSNPLVKSYSYQIGSEDSCGRIYTYWDYQTTMHLTTSVGLNGEVNLVWNPYSIDEWYYSFYIFRSVNNEPYVAIDSIASNTTTYTDLEPPPGELHYKVGIRTPSCYTGNETFTYSNRSSTTLVGIENAGLPEGVNLFPNPAHGAATLNLSSLAEKVKSITVISTSGATMTKLIKPAGAEATIDLRALHSGIYFIEVQTSEMMYRIPMAVQ